MSNNKQYDLDVYVSSVFSKITDIINFIDYGNNYPDNKEYAKAQIDRIYQDSINPFIQKAKPLFLGRSIFEDPSIFTAIEKINLANYYESEKFGHPYSRERNFFCGLLLQLFTKDFSREELNFQFSANKTFGQAVSEALDTYTNSSEINLQFLGFLSPERD